MCRHMNTSRTSGRMKHYLRVSICKKFGMQGIFELQSGLFDVLYILEGSCNVLAFFTDLRSTRAFKTLINCSSKAHLLKVVTVLLDPLHLYPSKASTLPSKRYNRTNLTFEPPHDLQHRQTARLAEGR